MDSLITIICYKNCEIIDSPSIIEIDTYEVRGNLATMTQSIIPFTNEDDDVDMIGRRLMRKFMLMN